MDLKVPVFSTKGSDSSHTYQHFLEYVEIQPCLVYR